MEPFIAYLLAGALFMLIGILTIRKGARKNDHCTAAASAVIVEVQKRKDDDSYTYTPVYEFTAGGITVRKSGDIYSTNRKKFRVGDSAAVRYNPDKPEEFLVNGKNGTKGAGMILLLFGIVLAAIAFTQR